MSINPMTVVRSISIQALWYGIVTARMEGIAAENSPQGSEEPPDCPPALYRFDGILGTRGIKPAGIGWEQR